MNFGKIMLCIVAFSATVMGADQPLLGSERVRERSISVAQAIKCIENNQWFDSRLVSQAEVERELATWGAEPSDAALQLLCLKNLAEDFRVLIRQRVLSPDASAVAWLNAADISSDEGLGEEYLRRSAKLGNHAAQVYLAASGVTDEYLQTAIDGDYIGAYYVAGNRAIRAQHYLLAAQRYRVAAEGGHPRSYFQLGEIYRLGSPDVPQDTNLSIQYYQRALDLGINEAEDRIYSIQHPCKACCKKNGPCIAEVTLLLLAGLGGILAGVH